MSKLSKSSNSKQRETTISSSDTEPSLDYNPIYKVNHMVNGSIDTIYIFNGKKDDAISQETLFNKIFTEEENDRIKTDRIKIKFSEQQIYFDDSIGTIKIKILIELKQNISLDEVYLFCKKIETLNSVSVYQSLTQNKKLDLTKIRLDQFISNIVSEEDGTPVTKPIDKDIYTYDDILEMKLEDKKYILNKVLGQKFFIVENEYPFVCDPYDVTDYDIFFEKTARKTLTTLNSNLLLSSGNILNNNIYLCLAKDVLEYGSRKDISEQTTLKVYYPFLFNKNINNLEELEANREKLVEGNNKLINDKSMELFETIDMFYDVYKLKKSDLNYQERGIKYIKAIMKPDFEIKIPLEVIFKIVHATELNPLIKYNPSSRQENVYRLFTDKIATDGRKIPYLKKATIFKLMKTIGKTKSVTIYIEKTESTNQTLICEFNENGYITITSEFQNAVSENEINAIFRESINPIIQEIINLLEQSGYKLNKFNSLDDDNIEIKQLTYESQIVLKKQLDIDAFKGCISAVFINETSVFKKGLHLRFKRVSNFSKVSSQEAFIIEKSAEGYRGNDIIDLLIENFPEDLDRKKAEELVRKVANEIQVQQGVRKNDIKIKENPGFKTTITIDPKTGIITISVENINDIHYLSTVPIYLDTMVRLTQDKNSTNYPLAIINKLCSSGIKEDVIVPDITSASESSASENEIQSLSDDEEESAEYNMKPFEKEKSKKAFSLFFDDNDENDNGESEETESKGGDINQEIIQKDPVQRKGFSVGFSGGETETSESEISTDNSSSSMGVNVKTAPGTKPKVLKAPVITKMPSSDNISSSEITSDKSSSSEVKSPEKDLSPLEIKAATPSESSSSSSSEITSDKSSSIKKESLEKELSPLEIKTATPSESTSSTSSSEITSDKSSSSEVKSPEKDLSPLEIKAVTPSESSSSSSSEITSDKSSSSEVKSPEKELSPLEMEEVPINISTLKTKLSTKAPTKISEELEPTIPIDKKKTIHKEKKAPSKKESSDKGEEEENEENEENEDEDEEDEEDIRNIDGMKLNKPYYFQTLIEKKDPVLILKEDTAEYNAYSRTCRSDMRRQPVILTDAQLTKIKGEYPGFLKEEDVIKYGSNPKNKFNYVCPRYWCLKTNTIIDPKELKEVTGKNGVKELVHPTCGKVLPKGDKVVKPGYYIYEFYGEDEKRYPGFQTDKHPNGYCLPCCFDKYNTEGRIKAKQKCYEEEKEKKEKEKGEKNEPIEQPEEDEYIKGPDKFPLEPGRWGYLPGEIQKMLHEVNADCQISKTNTNIKENHPCLLRHGVEVNKKQSFISCISDAIFFGKKILDQGNKSSNKLAKILNIKEMRERIIKSLKIDTFIKYQNGNLVSDFQDINRNVDLNKYNNSKIFSKLNMDTPSNKSYFTKVVSAFENFISFLNDDDAVIDHTYLWDIVSMPNKYIFPNGVNLVILQLPNDDITNNVQIICPTNHYSTEFYQARKPTFILIKEDGYYEPIYSYTNENKKITIAKEFKEYDPKLSKTIRAVLKEIIKPFLNTICQPLDSMPNVYKAKRGILLYDLIQKLDKYRYNVLKLVLNFNNKVIGVLANEPEPSEKKCFVPCYPSALDEKLKKDLDYVFMTDLSLWDTYNNTVTFLSKLEKRSKKRRDKADIPCKPAFKIVEDELVVGILTETNQFIQISKPIPEVDITSGNDLPSIKNDNYIVNSKKQPIVPIDVPITTETDVDDVRVDYIKKIKLETNFYNVFRNTIRILINDYENVNVREKIELEMGKEYIIYSDKLQNINKLLRELVKNKIQFIGDENYYKLINEVSTCLVKDKESCASTPNLCAVTENGKCNLILPEKNLITGKMNEPIYYGRMADEFIRYNRIKNFMLQPQTFLSFGNIGYNLRDNEVIMLQSLLTQDYFETLIPAITNKYIKYNSYDEAEPIITQVYENNIPSLDAAIGRKNEKVCDKKINDHITSGIWKTCFPDNYIENEYSKFNFCTFNFIIDLIEKKNGVKLTINKVKNELYDEYKKLLPDYKDKIVDILIIEGKKTLGDQVLADTLSFSSFIYTDNYFLTTFDLWLLVHKYKIPTVFICQKFILQTNYTKHEFVGYGNKSDKFAFVVIPGFRPENVPGYKLVESNDNDVFISLNKLNEECVDRIHDAIDNKKTIEEYLEKFVKPITTTYEKKKPTKLRLESDSESKESIKRKPKKLIIEETTPVPPEEFILAPKKKQTKKKVALKGKQQTKKNIKNPKAIVMESSSTENF